MSPKQILQAAFERTISPHLEKSGFRYVRSRFAYKREIGEFTQRIAFHLSHRNTQDGMRFWSAFNVLSPAYNRWRKRRGREPIAGAYLGGSMDWQVPGWPNGDEISFDFTRRLTRRSVTRRWLGCCEAAGIPYLDRLSSWEGAALDLRRRKWHWDRAADYFEIAGRPAMAIQALEEGMEILSARDFSYPEDAHPMLAAKRQRMAAERDAEKAAFERRILDLGGREHDVDL